MSWVSAGAQSSARWTRLALSARPTLRGWAVAALAVGAVLRLPTLAYPLTEAHTFRQTQTAFPAVIFRDSGIDLLYPQVPVLGPPWYLPFEFPLYQAGGAILMRLGLAPEVALRGLALATFLGTAGLLWLLLDRHVGPRAALIALAVFLFSPLAMLWSRTSMIEYPATLGSVAFMLGTLEWHRGSGRRWLALALVGGTTAALIKATTAAFWIAPALLTRRRLTLVVVAIPAVAALAWTGHADAVKAASPATVWLTSAGLVNWNFGGDRLSVDTWVPILSRILLTAGCLLAPAAVLVAKREERLVWLWMAVALVAPLLVFTNLYAVHDYYAIAVTPALAALIGGGADRLLARLPRLWPALAAAPIVALIATSGYWFVAYRAADPQRVLIQAERIRAATQPGDLVAVEHAEEHGYAHGDWSPAYFFYAERRGTMIVPGESVPPGHVFVPLPWPP